MGVYTTNNITTLAQGRNLLAQNDVSFGAQNPTMINAQNLTRHATLGPYSNFLPCNRYDDLNGNLTKFFKRFFFFSLPNSMYKYTLFRGNRS